MVCCIPLVAIAGIWCQVSRHSLLLQIPNVPIDGVPIENIACKDLSCRKKETVLIIMIS